MNLGRRSANPITAASNGESAAMQKLLNAFEKSKRCFPSIYSITVNIDANSSNTGTSRVDAKGDFLCEYITGKMYAVDGSGNVVSAVSTGILFNVNESGNNRDLFLAPVPAESILTPGYGPTIYEKWNLRDYVFNSTATLQVSAQNLNPTYKQILEISFVGFQFIGSFRK